MSLYQFTLFFILFGVCAARSKFFAPSYSLANFYGAVGVPVLNLSAIPHHVFLHTNEGFCRWEGQAPFCKNGCQRGVKEMRSKNGNMCEIKTDDGVKLVTYCAYGKDFGAPCFSGQKHYCCHRDTLDITWAGIWIQASSGEPIQCKYHAKERCGHLSCYYSNHPMFYFIVNITGYGCKEIHMNGEVGKAEVGLMEFPRQGKFYKTN